MLAHHFWCFAAIASTASCTLVIDRGVDQCATNQDCLGFLGAVCDMRAHLCRAGTNPHDAGMNSGGNVIGFMTGRRAAPPGLDLVALRAQRHVVPQCAMRVSRTEEIGPLSSFSPSQACGCYYEKVANGSTACTPCQDKTDCPGTAPFCNYGYCEMH